MRVHEIWAWWNFITRTDFHAIVYFYQNNKLACFTFQQRMTTALLFKVWWKTEIFLMDAMCVLSFFWHIFMLFLWRSLANLEFFCVLEVDHEHLVKHWNEWNNFRTCLLSSSPFFSILWNLQTAWRSWRFTTVSFT